MPIYQVFIDGKPRKIELLRKREKFFTVRIDDKTHSIELQAEKLDLGREFSLKIDGRVYKIKLPKIDREGPFTVKVEEATFKAEVKTPSRRPALGIFKPSSVTPPRRAITPEQVVEGAVTAPMTGVILSVMVEKGDLVEAGQVLCILEAMKMENEVTAPKAGIVQEAYVSEGSSVSEGEVLFVVD